MTDIQIRFTPVDTLFFRDGSPFNRQELQANVETIFPPSPTTLAGAARAAWARAMGWDGDGRGGNWDDLCKNVLGAGSFLPETIAFNGPYLFYDSVPVFPVPAHILGIPPDDPQKESPKELIFLTPEKKMETDLGTIVLPVKPEDDDIKGRKTLVSEWWVSAPGFNRILQGELPARETLIHQNKLWSIENRTGNYREKDRVTGLMSLYAPQHIRLQPGVELVMFARGLPDIDTKMITANPALTGGEARCCWLTIENGGIEQYINTGENNGSTTTVIALTPFQLAVSPGEIEIRGCRPVSCCNQRPVMLGGWDRDKPRQLVPCLQPGSVLFMKAENLSKRGEIITVGNEKNNQWGFGRFVTGICK